MEQVQNPFGDGDYQIADVENYHSDRDQVFNYQMLIMEVLRRANEAGSHELRAGWFNEKVDQYGNIIKTYVEDTRKRFIECVRIVETAMKCDFDNEAKRKVKGFHKLMEEKRKDLLKLQWEWFLNLPPKTKQLYAGQIIEGFFNPNMGWYLKFVEVQVKYHRKILEELYLLASRMKFYKRATTTA